MLPVQPMPTMTASTSFNRVAISLLPSREIRDRLRLDDVAFVAILLDQVGIDRWQPGEANHLPCDLIAVAAVDRISEEALHCDLQQRLEEWLGVEIAELGLARLQRLERILAPLGCEPVEILAVDLVRPGIGGDDAGREKLPWRERQLIAVFRLGLSERAAPVHFGAAAPRAGELPVDEGHEPAIAAGRREFVGRNHGVDRGCKERASAWVSVRWVVGSLPAAAAGAAAAGCWACAGAVGARPAATAVLAPNRKLRRAIGLLSSGVFLSVMATSRACRARAWLLHAGRGLRRAEVVVATRRFIVSF